MRILLLTTHLNIGGIGTYTVSLAKALKGSGEEVFVASSGGVLVPELIETGIRHIELDILTKSELSPKVFKTILSIRNLVKKFDIDIIHAQTRVTQVAAFWVSKLCRVKVVTTCHGFFKRNITRLLFPCWGRCVIAISEPVRDHLMKELGVDKRKISLIYNGIEVKRFFREDSEEERNILKDRFGLRKNYAILGTISRFTPDKGHDVILYAFSEILKKRQDLQLLFVGEGKERYKIENLAKELGLGESVVFLDSQMDTQPILSIIDIFLFTPRRREGLGLAPLEAMAAGKVVVATNVGGVSTIVKDGESGYLVEPSQPQRLVGPIMRLLEDRELYKRMSRAARETVIERFSIDGMVEKVLEVYRGVTQGPWTTA